MRAETRRLAEGLEADCDRILIDRLQGGDKSAFEEIVARHKGRIYAMTHRMLGNHEDAEEVTQDAFVQALRALASFRGESAFSTWLCRIAINLARNRYWYWARRFRHKTISFDAPLSAAGTTTHGDVIVVEGDPLYGQIETDDLLDRVQRGMRLLSSKHREILILRTVRNASYKEIAKILSISIGTVKSRILRAREDLRALSLIDAEP